MKEIKINTPKYKNKIAYVDDEIYLKIKDKKLYVTKTENRYYAMMYLDGKATFISRYVVEYFNKKIGKSIKHINKNTLDCRYCNLKDNGYKDITTYDDYVKIDISTEKYKNKYMLMDINDYSEEYRSSFYSPNGYAVRWVKKNGIGKYMLIHRMIMSPPKGMLVDHKDHNPLNNRRCNLRVCTKSQNQYNRILSKKCVSKHKGVAFATDGNRKKKWIASIGYKNKRIRLGRHLTQDEAAKAYNCASSILHGEYAYLNII